jgi:DeoR/GlpR family transcriptional regulator of sugar metabolism
MNQVERLRYIQDALSRQDFISLEDICAALEVSPATVRRDLIQLEQNQNIRRVHGGAMSTSSRDEALDFRRLAVSCQDEKIRIGRVAAEQIQDRQTVILGGGPTVAEVARCLLDRPIQILSRS